MFSNELVHLTLSLFDWRVGAGTGMVNTFLAFKLVLLFPFFFVFLAVHYLFRLVILTSSITVLQTL